MTDHHRPHGPHRPALGAHRLLGFGAGAALIRPDGEIDWWCRDRFDATPTLWSLLDARGAGARWAGAQIASWDGQPAGPTARTTVRFGERRVMLWDGLVEDGSSTALVRLARVQSGEPIAIEHHLRVGGFDAPVEIWTTDERGACTNELFVVGQHLTDANGACLVTPLTVGSATWTGLVIRDASSAAPRSIAMWIDQLRSALEDEERFLDHIQLPHHHPSRAVDALRVLRVLTDRSSGAPVASPTTSLPEHPGGDRQFDYRYTWLRDAAYAVATASLLGRKAAASDYLEFLDSLLRRYGDHLMPMTTTTGDTVPDEHEVAGVAGWADSRPIRVGNAAKHQRQLDSISTVIDAISVHIEGGGRMTARAWSIVDRMATMLALAPFEPTGGIWELREPALLVTDELARWIGLDIALRLRRRFRPWARRPEWVRARDEAWQRVDDAFDEGRQMLPQRFDGPFIADGATLLAAIHGFYPRGSAQARAFVDATIAALEEGQFVRRNPRVEHGPSTFEGAFIPVSWWAVTALAVVGELERAEQRADAMCAQLPPLLSEEWSVEHNEALGNTPLLWSHTEIARSLHQLTRERFRQRYGSIAYRTWRAARYLRLRFT
ncbi:MAG: hypothetical protein JWN62_4228, partial [Acidimicrobiales bacterium]|nr:hypothetical protein [Acidimicrobiales bacterium]